MCVSIDVKERNLLQYKQKRVATGELYPNSRFRNFLCQQSSFRLLTLFIFP